MEKNIIQDSLSFFAFVGTMDVLSGNKMVNSELTPTITRRRKKIKKGADKNGYISKSVQLSLF